MPTAENDDGLGLGQTSCCGPLGCWLSDPHGGKKIKRKLRWGSICAFASFSSQYSSNSSPVQFQSNSYFIAHFCVASNSNPPPHPPPFPIHPFPNPKSSRKQQNYYALFQQKKKQFILHFSTFHSFKFRGPQQQMDTFPFPWALSICVPLFCLLISLAFSGNSLVIAAIFYDRKLRKQRENLFLVSLALSDLFVSALVMVLAAANDLLGYWPFGAVFCQFWICLDISCSTASILNLCAIALDRFIHISRPMRYARFVSRRVICAAVCAIWLLSASLGIAQIAFGATDGGGMELEDERREQKTNDWSMNWTTEIEKEAMRSAHPHHHHYQCQLQLSPAYAVFSSLLSFFLPATLMLFLYYRLYLYARRHVRSIQAQLKQATSLLILQLASDRVRQVVVRPSMGLVPPSVALQYETTKRLSGAGLSNGSCRAESSHVSVAVHKGSDTAIVDATVRQGTPILCATLRKAKLTDNNNYYGGEESPFTPSPNKRHNNGSGGGGGGSSDRKARTTLGVIMGTFLVCWLPFFVVNVWRSFLPELCPIILFQAVTWLGYANSSVNPIIYGIFNRDFRRAFSRIVNKLLHCLQQEETAPTRSETESIRCRRKGENNNLKVDRGGWRWRLRSCWLIKR